MVGVVGVKLDTRCPGFVEREVRSMAYQLKAARFPAYRDLAGFDFASSEVNEALVKGISCVPRRRGDEPTKWAATCRCRLCSPQARVPFS